MGADATDRSEVLRLLGAPCAVVLIAACGRIDFAASQPEIDAPPTVDHNIAFVTSTTQLPMAIGEDLAGGDAICNERAAAGGLAGSYVVLASTSMVNARDQLAGSRGWVRTDGRPVLDLPDDIESHEIYYPVERDESGAPVVGALVITGTLSTGDADTGANCNDYASASDADVMRVGGSASTGTDWLNATTINCDVAGRLYCFGVGKTTPLTITPASGRRAFLTTESYVVDGNGLATPDALCTNEASLAGLSGTFAALLATSSASAISRFSLAGDNWVRLDGVPIADSPLAFAGGQVNTPINLTPASAYDGGLTIPTGGATPSDVGASATTCEDWTSPAGNAVAGIADASDAFFDLTSMPSVPCTASPIYCLEQ